MSVLGGLSPLYQGFEFNSGNDLLIAIRDYLLSKSWQIILDNINTTLDFTAKGITVNGHNCYIIFFVQLEAQRQYLSVAGDLDGTNSILSGSLELDFNLGDENRLFLNADHDSGGICLKNNLTYSGGISFGFLERFDDSDPYAWHIAKANNKLNDAWFATSVGWQRIGDSFYQADQFSSAGMNGGYQGLVDFTTAIAFGAYTTSSIANAGFFAHLGRINGLNQASLITRRFYIEGSSFNNYSPESLFNCRGFIKHFYNGFGEILGGGIFNDQAGNKYLSVGSDGWQALSLSETMQSIVHQEFNLPVVYFGGDQGHLILSSDQAFANIYNILINIGWEVIESTSTDIVLRSRYLESNEYCYLGLNNQDGILKVFGEVREDLGINGVRSIEYAFTNFEKIWISANQQATCIVIKTTDKVYPESIYFGFYGGQIDPENHIAWGIGRVTNDLAEFYVAKSFFENEIWSRVSDDFNYSTNTRSSYPSFGTSDRLSVPLIPFDYYGFADNRNSAINAHLGRINGATGQPQLDFFAVVEGRKKLDYGSIAQFQEQGKALFYLGYIQFCCVGMTPLEAGSVFTNDSNAKFLRVEGETGQGVQIG